MTEGTRTIRLPHIGQLREGLGLIAVFVVLVIVMSLLSEFFLKPNNLVNLLLASSTISMIAVFTTMLMIGGGLDLSVAAVAALTGVIIAAFQEPLGIWGATGLALLISVIVGMINGFLVTYIRINPFITTLGTMSVARGLAFVLSDGLTVPVFEETFVQLGEGVVAGIPIPVIVTGILFVLVFIILRFTTYGRAMYAMGGNADASFLAGLPINRYRMIAYTLSGLSAGIAGVFLASRLYAADPKAAPGLELSVIAAVVLGGTSLAGGKGTIIGTLFGVLILATLTNGMTLLSLPTDTQQVIQGVVLLLAVGLDHVRFGSLSRIGRLRT